MALPFDVLIDIADFSLHNAIVQLGDRLLHQGAGIAMGDPISPGMAIIVHCTSPPSSGGLR